MPCLGIKPWPFGSQAPAQSTELHQPGLLAFIALYLSCYVPFPQWAPPILQAPSPTSTWTLSYPPYAMWLVSTVGRCGGGVGSSPKAAPPNSPCPDPTHLPDQCSRAGTFPHTSPTSELQEHLWPQWHQGHVGHGNHRACCCKSSFWTSVLCHHVYCFCVGMGEAEVGDGPSLHSLLCFRISLHDWRFF